MFFRSARLPYLVRYARDLTDEARQGLLEPVVGRAAVLERMAHVLLRRTKNNPLLLGDPGVGKTAVVEALANAIAAGTAPARLADKRVLSLDLAALLAGTQYRGSFEERLQGVIAEAQASRGRVILFIDEIHTIVGAGQVEGSMDAANMLKPALARGSLHCIGATTFPEYEAHIARDSAIARRLQPVVVDEPSAPETLAILGGLQGRYEAYHGVRYAPAALRAAVALAAQHGADRRRPDSAIDLLDEAAALAHMQSRGSGDGGAATPAAAPPSSAWGGARPVQPAQEEGGDAVAQGTARKDESGASGPTAVAAPGGAQPQGVAQATLDKWLQERWRAGEPVSEANHQRLLQWFGATPASPRPGVEGHQQVVAARNAFLRDPSAPPQPAPAADEPGGRAAKVCPHCGDSVPSAPAATLVCPACGTLFLNELQDKLMLGTSVLALRQARIAATMQRPPSPPPPTAPTPPPAATGPPGSPQPEPSEAPKRTMDTGTEAAEQPAADTRTEVTEGHVIQVVAAQAGVPIGLLAAEPEAFDALHMYLRGAVLGQDAAIGAIVQLLMRTQLRAAALHGHDTAARGRREAPSLLLEGPPGCGKTALTAALAEAAFPHPTSVCWLSMAQFAGPDGATQLLGPPPGMVGHREGGVLTQQIRKRRRFLLVAEDLPLAHPGVLELLTTMLRTGSVTAGATSFDCRHITLVATRRTAAPAPSDSAAAQQPGPPARTAAAAAQQAAYETLVATLDKTVTLAPLDEAARTRIAAAMLERAATDMRGWKGAHVAFAETVLQRTARGGAALPNEPVPPGAAVAERAVSGHEVCAAAQEVEEAVLEHVMVHQRGGVASDSSLYVSLDQEGRLRVAAEAPSRD